MGTTQSGIVASTPAKYKRWQLKTLNEVNSIHELDEVIKRYGWHEGTRDGDKQTLERVTNRRKELQEELNKKEEDLKRKREDERKEREDERKREDKRKREEPQVNINGRNYYADSNCVVIAGDPDLVKVCIENGGHSTRHFMGNLAAGTGHKKRKIVHDKSSEKTHLGVKAEASGSYAGASACVKAEVTKDDEHASSNFTDVAQHRNNFVSGVDYLFVCDVCHQMTRTNARPVPPNGT